MEKHNSKGFETPKVIRRWIIVCMSTINTYIMYLLSHTTSQKRAGRSWIAAAISCRIKIHDGANERAATIFRLDSPQWRCNSPRRRTGTWRWTWSRPSPRSRWAVETCKPPWYCPRRRSLAPAASPLPFREGMTTVTATMRGCVLTHRLCARIYIFPLPYRAWRPDTPSPFSQATSRRSGTNDESEFP